LSRRVRSPAGLAPGASLWEHGLSLASVTGTDLLDRRTMALIARSLALRGEFVALIDGDELIPCSDWDLVSRFRSFYTAGA
jgi:hypothetical protein